MKSTVSARNMKT